MANIVNLGSRRAIKNSDPKAWSVADCLRYTLDEIERGEISPDRVYIALTLPTVDGPKLAYRTAGASALEVAGMLAAHLGLKASGE